jgi:outer membrane protein assembly factor BamA
VRIPALGACAALLWVNAWSAAHADAALPRIRSIQIDHKPVFTENERLQLPFLPDLTFVFRAANFLHIDTKEEVIRRELLLHEGDLADPFLIEESERNLRALPYIRQVKILSTPAPEGQVDLVVQTQDTWTTQPRASFTIGGGSSRSAFGIVETNVLGYGKQARLLYRSGLDRDSLLFGYNDPRLFGTRWAAFGDYQKTSDGRVAEGGFRYPFFSLDTPWAGGSGYSSRRERNKVFDHFGDEIASFRRKLEASTSRVGHRLEISDADVVWRAGVFYTWLEETYSDLSPGAPPSLLPTNRRESQPGVFVHREAIRFVRERHLNLFDRIEDLNLGNTFDAQIGYSWQELGALVDEPILTMWDRQGYDLGPGRKVFLYGLLTGRYQGGEARNAVGEVEAVAYYRWHLGVEHTLVSRVKTDLAKNLDGDTQLFLGNFNGLRGFKTRQFVGEKRFIFNLEDRLFFVEDLFHLVSLGAVVFFDAGYVWEPNQGVDFRQMATSVGIGLRIDAPRGSGEALFRIDLGVPITDGGSGTHGPGVTLGTGQAFDPFSGPFDLQSTSGP